MKIKTYIIGSFIAYFIGLIILIIKLDTLTFIGIVLYFGGATTVLLILIINWAEENLGKEQKQALTEKEKEQ